MCIVDHSEVPESPWRPNYRMWHLVGPSQNVAVTLDYSRVGTGAGAPLHVHEDDELITVLEGELEVRVGDAVLKAGPENTIVVPKGTVHGFTSVSEEDSRVITYFPVPDPFARTTYVEGGPAAGSGS